MTGVRCSSSQPMLGYRGSFEAIITLADYIVAIHATFGAGERLVQPSSIALPTATYQDEACNELMGTGDVVDGGAFTVDIATDSVVAWQEKQLRVCNVYCSVDVGHMLTRCVIHSWQQA